MVWYGMVVVTLSDTDLFICFFTVYMCIYIYASARHETQHAYPCHCVTLSVLHLVYGGRIFHTASTKSHSLLFLSVLRYISKIANVGVELHLYIYIYVYKGIGSLDLGRFKINNTKKNIGTYF